jgi:hypothetical protein
VLIPVCGRPPTEWPVGFYDENAGAAEIFATTITRWFPAYIIYASAAPEELAPYADAILAHCKKHFDFDAKALVSGLVSGRLSTAAAYGLVEPKSYVHRFHELVAKKAPAADFIALAADAPFYNAPLRYLAAKKKLDDRLARDILYRNLRWDFRGEGIRVRGLVETIGKRLAGKDPSSPFEPMFQRIRSGDWRGAKGFYEAGKEHEARGELTRAIVCHENAVFFERCETERMHHKALLRVGAIAKMLGDATYVSYFGEVDMPDADWADEPDDEDE